MKKSKRKVGYVIDNVLYEVPYDTRFNHTRDMVSYLKESNCPPEYLEVSDLDMRILCYFIEYFGNFSAYRASSIARYFVENNIDPIGY